MVSYSCFRATPRSRLEGTALPLKMGPTGCPETSVINANFTLRKIPKERRYYLHRSGSLEIVVYLHFVPLDISNEIAYALG